MLNAFTNIGPRLKAAALAFRSYDGAGGGRRWRGAGEMPLQLAAMTQARGPIGRRARYLAGNNPMAASAVNGWISNAIGTGIKPQSAHPDPTIRSALNTAFERWCDVADADGQHDHYGQQALALRRVVVDGDVFAMMSLDGATGNPLRVRMLDAEQVEPALSRDLGGGAQIISGVEFNPSGQRVAYHAFRDRPGLNFAGATSFATVRLPAESVVHVFDTVTPGQVRGLSWFAPVLLRLHDYDGATDAQLMRQKTSALFTGYIVNPNGEAGPFAPGEVSADGNGIDAGMEPGTMKILATGQDVRFSDPAEIGAEAIDYLKVTAREIAAGLGIPAEIMTGDLSGVNFSSIRAGLIEFRRRVEAVQYNVMVFRFCKPIWERFVLTAVLSGEVDGRGFGKNPAAFMAVKWITPKQAWVDPLKDARAEIEAINAGIMSRREAVAARGWDIEQLDAEIASDHERAKRLNLQFGLPSSPIDPDQEAAQ